MKAVALTSIRKAELIQIPKPIINDNQILMRIKACALCTTEQRNFYGEKSCKFPFVGGHEISGFIEEIGKNVDPNKYPIGAHCTGRTQIACGSCYHCKRGEFALCKHLADYRYNGPDYYGYGGLAEYIALDQNSVWLYPNDISFEALSITEPLACVLNSVNIANPIQGDDALVIGGGIMGQLHLMVLNLKGVRTILSEPDEKRRKFALDHGCKIVIDPTKQDLKAEIMKLTNNQGVETIINTTAIPAIEQNAIGLLSSLGTLVTYSSQHPDSPVEFSPNKLHNSCAKLTGAVNPSIQTFTQAVNLIGKGIIDTSDLVSKVFDMKHCQEAFEASLGIETYRVVIKMEDE